MPELAWRDISTPNLHNLVAYDGERAVARIYKAAHQSEWRWTVHAIIPAGAGVTSGYEADLKEARQKVEVAWTYAKLHGEPTGNHLKVEDWSRTTPREPVTLNRKPTNSE